MRQSRIRLLNNYLEKQSAAWYNPFTWFEDGADSPWINDRETNKDTGPGSNGSPGGSPGGGGGGTPPSAPVTPGSSVSDDDRRAIIKDFLDTTGYDPSEKKKKGGKDKKLMRMMMLSSLLNNNNSGGGGFYYGMPVMGMPFVNSGGGGGMNPMMLMMLASMSSRKSKKVKTPPKTNKELVDEYLAARPYVAAPVAAPTPTATAPDAGTTTSAPAPAPGMYTEEDIARRKAEIDRAVAADRAIEDDADRIINNDIQEREINRRQWKRYRILKSPLYAASMLTGGYLGDKVLGDLLFGNKDTRTYSGDGLIGRNIWGSPLADKELALSRASSSTYADADRYERERVEYEAKLEKYKTNKAKYDALVAGAKAEGLDFKTYCKKHHKRPMKEPVPPEEPRPARTFTAEEITPEERANARASTWREWWARKGLGLGGTILGYFAAKYGANRWLRPEDLSKRPLPIR